MILRRLLQCGVWGRVAGCLGGVWGPRHLPPSATPSVCAVDRPLKGNSQVYGLVSEGNGRLHTLSTTEFTWSRRRRRREEEKSLAEPVVRYFSGYSRRSGGGGGREDEGVFDDDAKQVDAGLDRSVGGFDITSEHRHQAIRDEDIGEKVNVGEPVIAALHRLYHIPRDVALKMVESDSFLLVSDTSILQTLYYLKDINIEQEQLVRIPWIMLQSSDTLQRKLTKLQEPHLFASAVDGLGFCWFSLPEISRYQRFFARESKAFPNHRNRLYCLADSLEVEVAVLVEKIVKPRQVIKMNMTRLNNLIHVFRRYGVLMEDVVSDLWVFQHNTRVTEERLRLACEAGVRHPKPWICHSSDYVFQRYLERMRAKNQVLRESGDLVTYLAERLGCSRYEVEVGVKRNPGLATTHLGKVRRVINLLYAEGFTPEDLRSCIRVIKYSEKRTKKRIAELKSLGHFPFPISLLYKSPSRFTNYVLKLRQKEAKKEEAIK